MNQPKLKSSVVIHDNSNNNIPNTNINTLPENEQIENTTENYHEMHNLRKKHIPFWTENPNVLLQPKYIFEFFPVDNMSYEQKLNAVSRTVIILTIIGFLITKHFRIIVVGLITMGAIYLMYYYHNKEKENTETKKNLQSIKDNMKEGFEDPAIVLLQKNNIPIDNNLFMKPNADNPFSNVLMTDYDYNPNKKPAPPAFNTDTNNDILKQAKQMVSNMNPEQPGISDKLFKDLGEELEFEQSLRQFNSNPSTTIPNDQQSFAEFCYGSMISSKEGNMFSLARNLSHYNLY